MKIIGTIGNNSVLIEAHRDEAANCMGYYCASAMPRAQQEMKVGDEIPVNEMYAATRSLIESNELLSKAVDNHQKLVNSLRRFSVQIAPAIKAVEEKKPKS